MRIINNKIKPFFVSVLLYIMWLGMTYLLEGRILTLRRPEAVVERLSYIGIANIAIGIIIAFILLEPYILKKYITLKQMGFGNYRKTLASIFVGFIFGLIFYIIQSPPSMNPIVIVNAYAQVLSVSIAEIVVCWAIVGTVVESYLKSYNEYIAIAIAIVISSIAFGVYHFGHSPPFNTINMVILLTFIGLITGLFYFISRNIYGTITFHNFLGIFGVTKSLDEAGKLSTYTEFQMPLFLTAIMAIIALYFSYRYILKPSGEGC